MTQSKNLGCTTQPSKTLEENLAELRKLVNSEPVATPWERFDQMTVSRYGAITGEDLWIHTDPELASRSQFGKTIVQASLLMSRFGGWIRAAGLWLPDPAIPINYGYDRVRIPGALPVDEAVRGQVKLTKLTESKTSVRLDISITAERMNVSKPVITADWIVVFLLPE